MSRMRDNSPEMNPPDDYIDYLKAQPAPAADPVAILGDLGAKWSPAFTREGPLTITARDCVICGPGTDCICHTIEFGSPEYYARLDRLHGRK